MGCVCVCVCVCLFWSILTLKTWKFMKWNFMQFIHIFRLKLQYLISAKYIFVDQMFFITDSNSKESACNAGDPSSIPGSGRSPGEGNGYPLHYSCLENSVDRGDWQAAVHGVTKSQHDWATNTFTFWDVHSTVKSYSS